MTDAELVPRIIELACIVNFALGLLNIARTSRAFDLIKRLDACVSQAFTTLGFPKKDQS